MTQSATEAQPKAKKNKLSSGFFRFVLTRFLLIIPTVFILVTVCYVVSYSIHFSYDTFIIFNL